MVDPFAGVNLTGSAYSIDDTKLEHWGDSSKTDIANTQFIESLKTQFRNTKSS